MQEYSSIVKNVESSLSKRSEASAASNNIQSSKSLGDRLKSHTKKARDKLSKSFVEYISQFLDKELIARSDLTYDFYMISRETLFKEFISKQKEYDPDVVHVNEDMLLKVLEEWVGKNNISYKLDTDAVREIIRLQW